MITPLYHRSSIILSKKSRGYDILITPIYAHKGSESSFSCCNALGTTRRVFEASQILASKGLTSSLSKLICMLKPFHTGSSHRSLKMVGRWIVDDISDATQVNRDEPWSAHFSSAGMFIDISSPINAFSEDEMKIMSASVRCT